MPGNEDLYAIYLRKSRADVEKEKYGQFETLTKHEQELNDLARRRKYVVDKTYKELVSGEHISERQEFQKMMKEVGEGKYAGIIVHSISRLGRGNPFEYGWTLLTLQMSNTLVVTPSKIYDPNNEDDARYLQMEMFINNMELGNIKSRMVSGERAAARAGCFIKSTSAYGYDRVKIDGCWTLAPNEDAPVVRMIFERAAAGESHGSIASALNDAKIPTKTGKRWSATRVLAVIKNPHYKGMIRYGYYKNEKVMGENFEMKRKQTYNEDCILVEGLHEPLVSKDIWKAANDNIAPAPRVPDGHAVKNPLAGLLVCAKCGRAMVRYVNTCPSNGNRIEHFRHAAFTDCHMRGANLKLVVSLVVEALMAMARDVRQSATDQGNVSESEVKAVRKALQKEENALDKLLELYFAEAISLDEFKERRIRAEERKSALSARLAELTCDKKPPEEVAYLLEEAVSYLEDDTVPVAVQNTALKNIIKKIEYDNRTVSLREPDIRLNIILRD